MASFMNTDIDYIGYKNIALFKVSDIQQHCVIKVDTFRIYIFKIAQERGLAFKTIGKTDPIGPGRSWAAAVVRARG